jgi:pimeloyl-ACP methyl ester carboxylesterase
MGVQVALQLWRARPDLVDGKVLTAGGHASPFRTLYGGEVGRYVFPAASIRLPALPRALGRRVVRAIELPVAQPVARWLRAVGNQTPWLGMTAYRAHASRLDHRTAIWTARGMHTFDATAWLSGIDVPTVVMVGTTDGWCPVAVAREIADAIADSHLDIIQGGSHTLPLEFPDRVLQRVRGLTSAPQRSAALSTRSRRTDAASSADAVRGSDARSRTSTA